MGSLDFEEEGEEEEKTEKKKCLPDSNGYNCVGASGQQPKERRG